MPGEEEDDTIHMGNAIMTFYSALIDLLGRCAPEMHVSYFVLHTCVCSAVSVLSLSSSSVTCLYTGSYLQLEHLTGKCLRKCLRREVFSRLHLHRV